MVAFASVFCFGLIILAVGAKRWPDPSAVGGHAMRWSEARGDNLQQPESAAWRRVAPLPVPRSTLALVSLPDGTAVAVGGVTDGGQLSGDCEQYSPETDSWASLPHAMPTPRSNLGCALWGDEIFCCGGLQTEGDPAGGGGSAVVEALNTTTWQWRTAASMPRPREGVRAVVMTVGNAKAGNAKAVLALIGGFTGPFSNSSYHDDCLQLASPQAAEWTPLQAAHGGMPFARSNLGVAAVGAKTFAFGGSETEPAYSTVAEFGGAEQQWRPAPGNMTEATTYTAVAVVSSSSSSTGSRKSFVHAAGGMDGMFRPTSKVERMDSTTGLWGPAPSLPVARGGMGGCTIGSDKIFVAGGADAFILTV